MSNLEYFISYKDAISRIMDIDFTILDIPGIKFYDGNIITNRVMRAIGTCKKIDLEAVIRCRECKHRGTKECKIENTSPTDFCSRAEKVEIKFVKRNYKKVTREEFYDFINNHTKKLTKHGIYFATPPIIQYIAFPENFDAYRDNSNNYCEAYILEAVPGCSKDIYFITTDTVT